MRPISSRLTIGGLAAVAALLAANPVDARGRGAGFIGGGFAAGGFAKGGFGAGKGFVGGPGRGFAGRGFASAGHGRFGKFGGCGYGQCGYGYGHGFGSGLYGYGYGYGFGGFGSYGGYGYAAAPFREPAFGGHQGVAGIREAPVAPPAIYVIGGGRRDAGAVRSGRRAAATTGSIVTVDRLANRGGAVSAGARIVNIPVTVR